MDQQISSGIGVLENMKDMGDGTHARVVYIGGQAGGGAAVSVADGADVALGAKADAAASSDGGAFSLIALAKRALGNWTTLLARIPALSGGKVPVDVTFPGTQPVSGTVAVTGVATATLQGTGNTSLSSIDGKLPASLGAKTAAASISVAPATDANLARESYSTVTPLSLSTQATGANFSNFGSQACTSLDLINNTGTTLEYRRGAGGTVYIPIPPGTSRLIQGITNANQIYVRRVDQSNTVVTMVAEAFTV